MTRAAARTRSTTDRRFRNCSDRARWRRFPASRRSHSIARQEVNVCSFANPTRVGILFFVSSRRATFQETRSAAAFVRPLSSPTRTALVERRQRTHSTRGDWTLEPENQQPEPRRSSPEVEQHQLPADPNEPVRIESGSTDAARTADSEGVSVPVLQPSPGEAPPRHVPRAKPATGASGSKSGKNV